MGAKTMWAYRPPYGHSSVYLLNEKPTQGNGMHMGHIEYGEWRDMGGPAIKTGRSARVRIMVEEVRSDGA